MREVTIVIDEMEAKIRFQNSIKGYAKPSHDSYLKWLTAGVDILKRNLDTQTYLKGEKTIIKIQLPPSWMIHSAPGMTYAIRELIQNGMMADWHDGSAEAKEYKKAAELNKAELQSIINSLDM